MTKEHSPQLCQYLGRLELDAFQAREPFVRYMVFYKALESLPRAGLSDEDSKLARNVLRTRAEETRPRNIGCASGEAGDAD